MVIFNAAQSGRESCDLGDQGLRSVASSAGQFRTVARSLRDEAELSRGLSEQATFVLGRKVTSFTETL